MFDFHCRSEEVLPLMFFSFHLDLLNLLKVALVCWYCFSNNAGPYHNHFVVGNDEEQAYSSQLEERDAVGIQWASLMYLVRLYLLENHHHRQDQVLARFWAVVLE